MSAPFAGALGVVRIGITSEHFVAGLPRPMNDAVDQVGELAAAIARIGDGPTLIAFDRGDTPTCWVRARAVLTIDVVATEDPGA